MITRVVLFRWKAEVTDEQVEELMRSIQSLKGRVPGLLEMRCGRNVGGPPCGLAGGGGYTHVVVSSYPSTEVLDAYRAHPFHLDVVRMIDALEESYLLFQIET